MTPTTEALKALRPDALTVAALTDAITRAEAAKAEAHDRAATLDAARRAALLTAEDDDLLKVEAEAARCRLAGDRIEALIVEMEGQREAARLREAAEAVHAAVIAANDLAERFEAEWTRKYAKAAATIRALLDMEAQHEAATSAALAAMRQAEAIGAVPLAETPEVRWPAKHLFGCPMRVMRQATQLPAPDGSLHPKELAWLPERPAVRFWPVIQREAEPVQAAEPVEMPQVEQVRQIAPNIRDHGAPPVEAATPPGSPFRGTVILSSRSNAAAG